MKIVITGASGFLGSHLLNKLILNEHDTLSITRESINPLDQISKFIPDVVVHCAWNGGNNYKDVNNINQVSNVYDGLELLKSLATLPNKPKFIGFGSFAEYGTISNLAFEEDWERPINMYGLSKLTFKNYSKAFCEQQNMLWSWIRPCYVYGPGDVTTRLVPSVISRLANHESVSLDSCDKIIDYIYVDDFVNFVYSIIVNPSEGIYNICSGQQFQLRDIINTIAQLMNAEELITFGESTSRILTPSHICGSNLKIRKFTSFQPLTSLNEGLTKTIEYYKNNNNEKRNSH